MRSGTALLGRFDAETLPQRSQGPYLRCSGGEIEPFFNAATQAALARAVRLVAADVPVLVHGETGAGKEVFARRVHAMSDRADKPFVAVNCAALPESLIESELFGYEEGAFTGARRQGRSGLLRQAEGGILFLDEIGDMPLALQARLLRALQDRQVTPLGGGVPVKVDFALLCATHRPLTELVASGAFRSDLYFRIAQYVVELPALRDLPDRRALVKSAWESLGGELSGGTLAGETLECLAADDWPGNFRQLTGMLRALIALAEPGRPLPSDALPAEIAAGSPMSLASPTKAEVPTESSLSEVTLVAMQEALEAAGGNVSLAARRLGIDRTTLYRRLIWRGGKGATAS
jgi:transcriptional regulator of acetoin/glycerol metabolism